MLNKRNCTVVLLLIGSGISGLQAQDLNVAWDSGAAPFLAPNAPVKLAVGALKFEFRKVFVDGQTPSTTWTSPPLTPTVPDDEGTFTMGYPSHLASYAPPAWYGAGDIWFYKVRLMASTEYAGPFSNLAKWRLKTGWKTTPTSPIGSPYNGAVPFFTNFTAYY